VLFTGLHTGHARIRGNTDTQLQPADPTLTEALKGVGYRTGLTGKWSLGGIGTPGFPLDKGFDEFYGYFSQLQAHLYYPEMLVHNRREVALTGNWGTSRKQYAHDLLSTHALKFIDESRAPFFLHLAYTIPHANNELGRDSNNGMEVPSDEPYSKQPWPQVERNFAAMVTRLDRDIGRIFELLAKKGIDRDTLVLFSSDNGPHREGGHDPDFFDSNGVHRGIKRDLYDGGIRVPALARWPGTIAAGQVSSLPWCFQDVFPTCAELAGAAIPAGVDGHSIVPTLLGKPQQPHEFLYWEFHERGFHQAVRHQHWKAVRFGRQQPLELYDLRTDPAEATNVAARNPEVVRRIEQYLERARTDSPDYPIREQRQPARAKPNA
jgi:arylsulfatase A-like enzyme